MSGSSGSPEDFSFNDISHQAPDRADANDPRTISEGPKNDDQTPKPKRIACVLCRKRKLRCDGARPTCGTCKRLKHECAYDEVRRKSGPKRGYVKQLEARLQQVETMLKNQEALDQPRDHAQMTSSLGSAPSHGSLGDAPAIQVGNNDPMSQMFQNSGGISPGEPFPAAGGAEGMPDEQFPWEMIGLGLDEPLPPQDEINELNQIYFAKVHPSIPMIHRPRYYAAMNLAPFMRPPVCLRYAMWALAASCHEKYDNLQEHFYQRARKYIQLDEMRGHGESMITLGHCQAWALLCTYEFKQMMFPRAWVSAGRAVRLSQMMMLHRLDGTGLDVKQTLPPPKDWTEREERRRTFWTCFCIDRYASIGTGWPMSMEEKDILTNLPASDEAFDKSKPMPTPSLEEAMTPSGVARISAFGGVCLMASCFGRNLTHLHRPTPDDCEDDLNGEFWKRHRQLDNILLNTILSLPEELRMPQAMSDANAIFLQMCLHTSAICLHQAAIFKAEKHKLPVTVTNESKIRCMNAAAEIASLMRMISHLDLSSMNPFISFTVYVAARVFVQWLKNRPKDQQVLSSLSFLLQAMNALKKRNPLTESFMVQLDLDLEGIGIPGLRLNVDLGSKAISMTMGSDNVACSALYELRESQNPLGGVTSATSSFGAQNANHLAVPNNPPSRIPTSPGPPFHVTTAAAVSMDVQDSNPFGYVSDSSTNQQRARNQRNNSSNLSGHNFMESHQHSDITKQMRGIIIPILDSPNASSEMDTSPDASGDQPTPASSTNHGSSSTTSFSPPGTHDEGRSPNLSHNTQQNHSNTTHSNSVLGPSSSGINVPSSAAPSQNYFGGPDDDFATLAAQLYPGGNLNMTSGSGNGQPFDLPVQTDWNAEDAGGVGTGMESLSGSTWGQMLDVAGMGWEGMGPSHDANGGWPGRS